MTWAEIDHCLEMAKDAVERAEDGNLTPEYVQKQTERAITYLQEVRAAVVKMQREGVSE
jgi:hypothetical protein